MKHCVTLAFIQTHGCAVGLALPLHTSDLNLDLVLDRHITGLVNIPYLQRLFSRLPVFLASNCCVTLNAEDEYSARSKTDFNVTRTQPT